MSQSFNQMVSKHPVEIWAGLECTVNRVGDEYFDQLQRNGHATRVNDLDLFAELGIRTIRYPILWERIAPNGIENADWTWADVRLGRLRELGICPIVGLVHHGSGPSDTSLVDPEFPEKLAAFARAVAERYPWVTHYTPINEPLTTARFSGLYGHWYPHGRDELTFIRALLGQCRAIALSILAIREVNPHAQLVQTEDLGKIFSTPLLAYQAALENERRWLSFDLLCGRLSPTHPMWHYLHQCGVDEAELAGFLENPCPPDIMGINHYLTSDRLLDERIERYPSWSHGGNGKHQYADIEAVRVCAEGIAGHRRLLAEAWERYKLPLAITEVHLNCTREEQLRWLYEVWNTTQELRDRGVDVRAVTAWSLLGSYDWHNLVTRCDGYYEPGVFDVRSLHPRPTAIAKMICDLAAGHTPQHPLLATPGWWHRQARLLFPPVSTQEKTSFEPPLGVTSKPIAIVGATGTLGQAFARICDLRGISYQLLTRQEMDITDPIAVDAFLTELQPWAIVNAAGYVRVDDAEREPEICMLVNTQGPATLAAVCARHNIALLTFSSDLVFDGAISTPYVEDDPATPLNVYGQSKALAEERVLSAYPASLVIRTSAFFGPWDNYNFVTIALRELAAGRTFIAAEDAIVSPTYVPDLVHTSLDLLIDGECGLWHLANKSAIAWADLARLAAKTAGLSTSNVIARPLQELGLIAPRPSYSVLGSNRGELLPGLESAIARYFDELK
ncbi:family 1 glycosylhydrolase [Gloeocapsopsis sp. IPPAS B-1203]|uniref:family 1 glycosylhydrolase n=1 Tax=Gloeocapsopsis sp. IPPAS B-1203 TaxID=2049454 RepID=UPI0025A1EEF9|nr:family 1 glycosylhydrolase [Gloeocapsopsis sp. IPPAS B-1203]